MEQLSNELPVPVMFDIRTKIAYGLLATSTKAAGVCDAKSFTFRSVNIVLNYIKLVVDLLVEWLFDIKRSLSFLTESIDCCIFAAILIT